MMSPPLEITTDLSAHWPKERLATFFEILTTRLTFSGQEALTNDLANQDFAAGWIGPNDALLRAYDTRHHIDLSFGLGDALDRGPAAASLAGIRFHRLNSKVVLIPLPRQLWQPFEPPFKCCGCPYCLGHLGYLDTLAFDSTPTTIPKEPYTWLLHAPQLQRRHPRVRIAMSFGEKITPKQLGELYAAAALIHAPASHSTPTLESAGVHPTWRHGYETIWSGRTNNDGRGTFFERLKPAVAPKTASPHKLAGLNVHRGPEQFMISLPESLWVALEETHVDCVCGPCQEGATALDTLVVPYFQNRLDMTQLTHSPWIRPKDPK